MPAAIESSIAFRPGSVAGILMNTFGRSTILLSRRACSIVFSVSKAMLGSTSSETHPSRPSSHRGRRMSQAFWTSVTASSKKTSVSSSSRSITSRICSSYESPESNAFWKIDGLLVTPTTASSRISRSSSPLSIISRERESIQTLWPRSDSSCSRDLLMLLLLSVSSYRSLTWLVHPLNSALEPADELTHPPPPRHLRTALEIRVAIRRPLHLHRAQRRDVLETTELLALVLERTA